MTNTKSYNILEWVDTIKRERADSLIKKKEPYNLVKCYADSAE